MDEIDFHALTKGNSLAKAWARKILGRRKLGKFLNILFNSARAGSLGVSQEKVEMIQAIPTEDREAICATQDLVCTIFNQFDRLAMRIAHNFARGIGRDNEADMTQLESEARVGLLKAIRGYTKTEVKFVTYCHRAITNEISRYIQRNMGVTLTGANVSLVVKYKKEAEAMSKASQPHNFEDVCASLKLGAKQIARLKAALRSEVTSESELETNLASTLLDSRKNTKVDAEFIRELEKVTLSMLEKFAWISQPECRDLFPDAFPSLKEVAIHFDVTPQAASEALKRAKRKLASALGGDWTA